MKQNNVVIFIFGIIFAQRIVFFGAIHVGEIIAFVYFIFQFFSLRFNDFEKKLLFFAIFASILQAFSDVLNGVTVEKSLKGFFNLIIFVSTIFFLCRYLVSKNNFKRAIFFYFGFVKYIHKHLLL